MTTYAQRRVLEIRQYQQQGPQEVYQGPSPAPVRHSLFQEYNYGQTLQFQPPQPRDQRKRLPSPHLPRVVGAAAVAGARRRWINPNPYSGGSLDDARCCASAKPCDSQLLNGLRVEFEFVNILVRRLSDQSEHMSRREWIPFHANLRGSDFKLSR
jgi:hypothetical protein